MHSIDQYSNIHLSCSFETPVRVFAKSASVYPLNMMYSSFVYFVGLYAASCTAELTGFIGIKPHNKAFGEYYATFEYEAYSVTIHDKTMISMDSVGRRKWVITDSPTKPSTVVIASHWLDYTEPQGWVPYERLVSTSSPVRWVDVKAMYNAGEYNNAGFRIEKNNKPVKFDNEFITEYVILPPMDQIPMTAPGPWGPPKFHMCVKNSDFDNWAGDAELEGKSNPAHWGFSGSTLNLDDLQPNSMCEPVDVYLLGYPEPSNKKVKIE
ncbi:hypothetical protein TWF481_010891 [Arthrobotrys musiformis]|uniref:Uncharacterized protein n=1 Tax=Arthrobotrys musiformis TaxID=47236 RepID=A0AAV9VWP6_9PEZI